MASDLLHVRIIVRYWLAALGFTGCMVPSISFRGGPTWATGDGVTFKGSGFLFQMSATLEAHPAGPQRLHSVGVSGIISEQRIQPTPNVSYPLRDWSYAAWTADADASAPLARPRPNDDAHARVLRATAGVSLGAGTVDLEDQVLVVAARVGVQAGEVLYANRPRWRGLVAGAGVQATYVATDDGVTQVTPFVSVTIMNPPLLGH